MISFTVQKFSSLMWSNLWIFAFIACAFSIKKKKSNCWEQCKELLPSFSSRDFMGSGLIFKSKSILSSFFVSGIREGSNFFLSFFLLYVTVQFSQHHLLKRLLFPRWMVLAPLSNISWLAMCRFISGILILSYWSVCLFLSQYKIVSVAITLQFSLKSEKMMMSPGFL